jgi:hypothetical protein
MALQNSDLEIFNEWYEHIQIKSNKIGVSFAMKYDFYCARIDNAIK